MRTWFVRMLDDSNNRNFQCETAQEAAESWAREEWEDDENWWDGEVVQVWASGGPMLEFTITATAPLFTAKVVTP